ncbi:hypothetical protein HAX54_011069 [Datura stramonium]|uniref:Uncharacterized protein n=1 Tax=Datura stramonium TaxID=4076 RepID=A0ABS8TIU3_DATST|nr:hypothetical protein [Datura stramonium]
MSSEIKGLKKRKFRTTINISEKTKGKEGYQSNSMVEISVNNSNDLSICTMLNLPNPTEGCTITSNEDLLEVDSDNESDNPGRLRECAPVTKADIRAIGIALEAINQKHSLSPRGRSRTRKGSTTSYVKQRGLRRGVEKSMKLECRRYGLRIVELRPCDEVCAAQMVKLQMIRKEAKFIMSSISWSETCMMGGATQSTMTPTNLA